MKNLITDKARFYLYRHVRLDTNEVFYVGIGTKRKHVKYFKSYKYEYYRAYRISLKKSFWNNIVNKTKYEIEILLESDDYDFIKQKEIEFIKLYGRRNLGLGPLVNLTDGGEGTSGYIMTEEQINKGQKSWKRKEGIENTCSKICYQYSNKGLFVKKWDCLTDAAKSLNVYTGAILDGLKKSPNHYSKGFFWFYDYKGIQLDTIRISKKVII